METNWSLIFEWSLLSIFIVFLIYTMRIIKREKFDYEKSAIDINFNGYTLKVPTWWTPFERENGDLEFKRTDTRYDWMATYKILNDDKDFNLKIEETFRDLIANQNIQFDANEAIIHEPSEMKMDKEKYSLVRVEGMGTQNGTERIYLDAFLLRNLTNKTHLYGQSHSSVLNGMLEGPYFEEVLKKLAISLN